MKYLIAICAICFLTGCTSTATKYGAGPADFANDALECTGVGLRLGDQRGCKLVDCTGIIVNGVGLGPNAVICMQGKGWTITKD